MADQTRTNNLRLRLHGLHARFSQQFNPTFIKIKFCFSYFSRRDQQTPAVLSPHAAFAFTIFVILGFLQVKYQGKEKSPFESHPITISVGVLSILIYCFAYGVEQRLSHSSRRSCRMPRWAGDTVRWCMLFTGFLSVAATASCLFPDSGRPFFFAFCFVIVACERVYWVYQRARRESNWGSMRRFRQLFTDIRRPFARYVEHRQILPLSII